MKKLTVIYTIIASLLVWPDLYLTAAPSKGQNNFRGSRKVEAKSTFSVGDGRVVDFEKYRRLKIGLRNHRRETSTDYETIPGSVIHHYSDGSAVTSVVRRINCTVQTNTVEAAIEGLNEKVKEWQERATNSEARINRAISRLTELKVEAQTSYDNAGVLDARKLIYKAEVETFDTLLKAILANQDSGGTK